MLMFKNKNILLTGATGGIGSELAKLLYQKGTNLILVGRSVTKLEQLREQLQAIKHPDQDSQIIIITADINTTQGRQAVISVCTDLPNGLSALINNAATNHFGLLSDLTEAQIASIINLNTLVPILLTRALLPSLLIAQNPRIVNIGSVFGSIGFAGQTSYSASKFALRGFTQALSREIADTGIKIHYVAPRATWTDFNCRRMNAMNKELGVAMDPPEIVAQKIINIMMRTGNSRLFIGWPERLFVKLNSLLPGLIDRAVFRQLPIIQKFSAQKID